MKRSGIISYNGDDGTRDTVTIVEQEDRVTLHIPAEPKKADYTVIAKRKPRKRIYRFKGDSVSVQMAKFEKDSYMGIWVENNLQYYFHMIIDEDDVEEEA